MLTKDQADGTILPRVVYWVLLSLVTLATIQAFRYGLDQINDSTMNASKPELRSSTKVLIWFAAMEDAALLALITVALTARSRAVIWLSGWYVATSFVPILVPTSPEFMIFLALPVGALAGVFVYLVRNKQL